MVLTAVIGSMDRIHTHRSLIPMLGVAPSSKTRLLPIASEPPFVFDVIFCVFASTDILSLSDGRMAPLRASEHDTRPYIDPVNVFSVAYVMERVISWSNASF